MEINLLSCDGFGGSLTTYAAAKLLSKEYDYVDIKINCFFACSDNVWSLLNHFKPSFVDNLVRVTENEANTLSQREDYFDLTPDKFEKSGKFFNKFGYTWRRIKQERALSHLPFGGKGIYLAFATSQENNSYPYLEELISNICSDFPDYEICFPLVTSWGGRDGLSYGVDFEKLESKYPNLEVERDSNLIDSFCKCQRFTWFVGVDNGIMNFAYHLNAERFLIDFRAGNSMFSIRWRQNSDDSINPYQSPNSISNAIKLWIRHPHLTGIPRSFLFDSQRLINERLI